MNYADIKSVDIQDGSGVRVSIYVSGCHFHCKGCHNKEAWDFNYGKKFDDSTIDYILDLMDHDYISGLSILGGEPLEKVNQEGILSLTNKVKEKYPEKNIWCYTGYDFENDVLNGMYKESQITRKLMKNIDILVDGQFIEEKKLIDLKFRGSFNQKKIDVQASIREGRTISLKFGDEIRYENIAKEIVLSKDEYTNEKNIEESNNIISNEFDNVISIGSLYKINEVKEKVVASSITNLNGNNF